MDISCPWPEIGHTWKLLNVAAHICYEHCSLFLYIFAPAPGSFDLCNSFWNMKTSNFILFSEICLIYIWILVPVVCHVLLFPGCLCRRSGSFQFSSLHPLGAMSKKLSLMPSFFLFVVELSCIRRGHGILLKILIYCKRGPSSLQFSTWSLKTLEKSCEQWTFPFIFCLRESWGPLSWGAFLRTKKSPQNSCIYTNALWSTPFVIQTEIKI